MCVHSSFPGFTLLSVKDYKKEILPLSRGQLQKRRCSWQDMTRCVETFCHQVLQYAELTGDFNPVHLGDGKSAMNRSSYKIQPDKDDGVVHGALLLGLVSGLVATRLPGIHFHIQELEVCPLYPFLCSRQNFDVKVLKRTLYVSIP